MSAETMNGAGADDWIEQPPAGEATALYDAPSPGRDEGDVAGPNDDAVRLVVWDMDRTLRLVGQADGVVRKRLDNYRRAIVRLAGRGVVSSLCSRHDHEAVRQVLIEAGLWDYLVAPSVGPDPIGPRLKAMADAFGLRPSTVLFLDDSPVDRAEARAAAPEMQVRDETLAQNILGDPRLRGRPDPDLLRLAQYKLLETRKRAEAAYAGDHRDFLRGSGVVVEIDYDVEASLERALELISESDQLNFTKRRFPKGPGVARARLLKQIRPFWAQAGLIRVRDRYGDYGYVGFFVRGNGQGSGPGRLFHFCFSSLTIGMQVERWVYDFLGRPELEVVGAVLADLSAPATVDWIRLAGAGDETGGKAKAIPEVRLRGSCEIDALSHYFASVSDLVRRETSVGRGPFFIPKSCSHHLHFHPLKPDFLRLAQACGFEPADFESELFGPCAPGALLVLSTWQDLAPATYLHRSGGLLTVPNLPWRMVNRTEAELDENLRLAGFSGEHRTRLVEAARSLKASSTLVSGREERDTRKRLRRLFKATPRGCRLAVLAIDEVEQLQGGAPFPKPEAVRYNTWLASEAERVGAKVFYVGEHVLRPSERERTAHFERIVYYRLASAIIDWAAAAGSSPVPASIASKCRRWLQAWL